MTMLTKQLGIVAPKVKGNEFTAMISTDTLDRDGEVLIPDGCARKRYEENPVLLWMHDPEKPIGTGSPGATVTRKGNGLSMRYTIPERPEGFEGEWFPAYAAGLVAAGVLRTVSVRFQPLEGGVRMPNQADVKKYGPGVSRVYNAWELLEVSLVSIPANPDAVIEAVTKHYVTEAAAKAFGGIPPSAALPRPQEKRRIVVTVPAWGADDYEKAAKRAALKAAGRLYGPA